MLIFSPKIHKLIFQVRQNDMLTLDFFGGGRDFCDSDGYFAQFPFPRASNFVW